MKPAIKIPEFVELEDSYVKLRVRFDYDAGEDQWFDAKAGVGSPGHPASIEVTAVDFGRGWESPETYPQLNIEACEQEIMDTITRLEEAFWAEYAERMPEEL